MHPVHLHPHLALSKPRTPAVGPLALALVLGVGGMMYLGERSRAGASEAPESPDTDDPPGSVAAETRGAAETVLEHGHCADAGYLCQGLAQRETPRVLRWNDDTRVIRIGLPLPPGVAPDRARALQAAAAAGILAWQDKPFRIELQRRSTGSDVDFQIRWAVRLDESQLGRADTRWFREPDGRSGMQVNDFVLVHEDPFSPGDPLPVRKVQLAAAHEMGHALGLPHSDSNRDVMFPTNTARSLSVRDFASMAALYSMENGALLPPDLVTPP